jgi:hypothetical protein
VVNMSHDREVPNMFAVHGGSLLVPRWVGGRGGGSGQAGILVPQGELSHFSPISAILPHTRHPVESREKSPDRRESVTVLTIPPPAHPLPPVVFSQ